MCRSVSAKEYVLQEQLTSYGSPGFFANLRARRGIEGSEFGPCPNKGTAVGVGKGGHGGEKAVVDE